MGSTTLSALLGSGICCFVPLLSFFAGVWYARHGLPVSIQWRGFRSEEED